MAKFEIAIPHVLAWEGGYVNHPKDPGGETNRGITDRLDGKIDGKVDVDGDDMPDVNIRDLTEDQAKQIYKREFWDKMRGDEINSQAIANMVFDAYINMGAGRLANPEKGLSAKGGAIRLLQQVLLVKDDGKLGPMTLKHLNDLTTDSASERFVHASFKRARILYYERIVRNDPEKKVFLKGWLRRANSFPDL